MTRLKARLREIGCDFLFGGPQPRDPVVVACRLVAALIVIYLLWQAAEALA